MTPERATLIIVGAARSGTKLLRDLIALHPDVARVPYDVNYVWRIGNQNISHDELDPRLATPAVRRRILAKLEAFRQGRPILVEKTVSNCLRVPFVRQVIPEARFIQLLRDGRDVVESVHWQWLQPPDWMELASKLKTFPLRDALGYSFRYAGQTARRLLGSSQKGSGVWGVHYRGIEQDLKRCQLLEVCARQWVRCVASARLELAKLPPSSVLTLHYEQLVREPARELKRVARFSGIDEKPFEDLDFGWVRTDAVGRGPRELGSEGLARILPLISEELERCGYTL